MGQLYGHVADALFAMCATAAGSKPPRTGIEKTVSAKPELVAALKEGVSYCNTVFDGMTDQKGVETVPFYFGPTPRLSVLYFTVTHTYEHYGNLVTYMRLKNIVPPSSEPDEAGAVARMTVRRRRRVLTRFLIESVGTQRLEIGMLHYQAVPDLQ